MLLSPETPENMVQDGGAFAGQETIYARELKQLKAAGYKQVGNLMIHPSKFKCPPKDTCPCKDACVVM